MRYVLKLLKWLAFGLVGIITSFAFFTSSAWAQFIIGTKMSQFTEQTTQWTEIDFTTAVKGETPMISGLGEKMPALVKYRINGIVKINDVVILYGHDKNPTYYSVTEQEKSQACVFRSVDGGKTFDKLFLGHGAVTSIIEANQILYIKIVENDTNKVRYYRSVNAGQTWSPSEWMPTAVWKNGTLFIEQDSGIAITMSQDGGKTWQPLEGSLKEFYSQIEAFAPLNDTTLVGIDDQKNVLFFDLPTKTITHKAFDLPEENVVVSGFRISKQQLVLEVRPRMENGDLGQEAYYFVDAKEYAKLPKKLPKDIRFHVKDDYIGGWIKLNGRPVHVYTLDRGKHWNYEIIDDYFQYTNSGGPYDGSGVYLNGEYWFTADKNENLGVYLLKGNIASGK